MLLWSFGSCEVAFLFVCCWYIWTIFDLFPNRCPYGSVYVRWTQCYLQEAGWPDFLKKIHWQCTINCQHAEWEMVARLKKSAWTWSGWHWSRYESCSCLCAGCQLFRYECKQIIIKILIKLEERSPLQFSLVRVVSSLDQQKMVQSNSTVSLRFKKLAGNLWTLNKISSKIADNAKFEYDSFQSVAIKKHSEFFLTCDPRKERLGVFLEKYVRPEFENFWHICKVFIFLYDQSFVEHIFLVNNLTIDDNM